MLRASSGWLAGIASIIMLMAPLVPPSTGAPGAFVPDPNVDFTSGLDAPAYIAGDFWNYTTSFTYNVMGFNIPFTGWLNQTVSQITLDPSRDLDPVYLTDMEGNVSGHITIPFVGDIDIYVSLTGYSFSRVQDLSFYRLVLNATVSGSIPSINGYYPFGYEYSPALEEFDFPLIDGDSWQTNVSASLPFGLSGELVWFNQTYSCGSLTRTTVPAGAFWTAPVSIDGRESLFYNSTVGNTVKRIYSLGLDTLTIDVPFELERYRRGAPSIRIDLDILSDQPVEAGASFNIRGRTSASNTLIMIMFPGGDIVASVPLIGVQKEFQTTLTAPEFPDDTPTLVDFGSFGVLAIAGALDGIGVCTVTTRATDLMVGNNSLGVTHTGSGTRDDTFFAHVWVNNPSNFGASGFSVVLTLKETGTELLNATDQSLEARESLTFDVDFQVPLAGLYNLTLAVDPEGKVKEYDEANNLMVLPFEVLERTPLNWTFSPAEKEQTIHEGGSIVLNATVRRGELTLNGTWSLDNVSDPQKGAFNFTGEFIGARSSRPEPYMATFKLDEGQTYQDEVQEVSWNITVVNVNRPPAIISRSPINGTVLLLEGGNMTFSVNASDPDMDPLAYEWYLDNVKAVTYGPSFDLRTEQIGPLSSEGSPFHLEVVAKDSGEGSLNASLNWTISVIDVDIPFTVSVMPPPGNYSVLDNQTFHLGYNATDPDGSPLTSVWRFLDMTVHNDTDLEIDPLVLGLEGGDELIVGLTVASGPAHRDFSWNISIEASEGPYVPTPPVGVVILEPAEDQTFLEGQPVALKANDSDQRPLLFEWTLNGTKYTGREVVLTGLSAGSYIAYLRASVLNGTPEEFVELQVPFNIVKENIPPGDDDDGATEEGTPWWVFIVIGLLALLVLAILLLLVLRKGRAGEEGYEDWGEE